MNQTAAYQTLAEALLSVCPPGFTAARIGAALDDDWSDVAYSCDMPRGPEQGLAADADTDFKVDDALHALRGMMKQGDAAAWSRCTFTLFPDGRFKFDVEYDDQVAG